MRTAAFAILLLLSVSTSAQVAYDDAMASLARSVSERLATTSTSNVLVGSFKRIDGSPCELGSTLTLDLEAALINSPKQYKLLDRLNLEAMAEEHKLEMNGMMDEEQRMREAGKLLKADAMVFGYFTLAGEQLVLRIKVVDIQTSEQLTVLTSSCKPSPMIKGLCASAGSGASPVLQTPASTGTYTRPVQPSKPDCVDRTKGSFCLQNNGKVDLSMTVKFSTPYGGMQQETLRVRPGRSECYSDKPVGSYTYTLNEVYPENPVYRVKNTNLVGQGSIRVEGCDAGRMTYP